MGRDGEGEITNQIIMARNKTEERNLEKDGPKSFHQKRKTRLAINFKSERKTIKTIIRRKISKERTNRHKRTRKHCENRYRKNYQPERCFGPIISDRKESKTRANNNDQR